MKPRVPKNPSGMLARVAITLVAAGIFLILRPDITGLLQGKLRAEVRQFASPGIVDEYMRHNNVRKLQIGAGVSNKPGWLNTDIEPSAGQAYLDATQRFPLPDRSFQYVYSEHVIEHLTYEEGLVMLKESYRILAPGGEVRIATPNLIKFVELFGSAKTKEIQDFIKMKHEWGVWPQTSDPESYMLNQQLREWGHQFVYSPKLLRGRLETVGFSNIREFHVSESDKPELRNLEERAKWRVKDANAYETMIFQAVRE